MRTEIDAERLRQELDKKLTWLRRHRIERPMRGWIHHIREALTMTGGELANRLGVTVSTVTALQKSEVKGTIEIATLRKVAAAMECRLFYTFVPNIRLQEIMRQRRKRIATTQIAQVTRDALNLHEQRSLVEDWAKLVPRNLVWRELPHWRQLVDARINPQQTPVKKPMAKKAAAVQAAPPAPQPEIKPLVRLTPEEKAAKQKRFRDLQQQDYKKLSSEERRECWDIEAALIDDSNAEIYATLTPEEKAKWDRLAVLEERLGKQTLAEQEEYDKLSKEVYGEDDDEMTMDAARKDGDKKDDAKEAEDKKKEACGENASEAPVPNDEEPTPPMALAKVALVLGAGLKGTQPEAKASDTSKPKAEAGGPQIRML